MSYNYYDNLWSIFPSKIQQYTYNLNDIVPSNIALYNSSNVLLEFIPDNLHTYSDVYINA